MILKKRKLILILVLLNFFIIPFSFGINSNSSDYTMLDEISPKLSYTSLAWNFTMGDGGRGLSITPDGRYLVAGSWDRNVYFFNTQNPVPLWNKTLSDLIGDVVISADGEYIGVTTGDNKLYFFNKSSSTPIWNFTAGNLIRSLAITPDGHYIAAGSDDHSIYLFKHSSSTPIWNFDLGNQVKTVAISSDGNIIAGGGTGVGVHVFNSSLATAPIWFNSSMTSVLSLDISANDQYLVAGTLTGVTGTIYLYNLFNSTPLQEYEASHTIGSVSITSNGDYFVGGVSFESRIYLFEKGINNPKWNFTAEDQIEEVEISEDGNFIAFGSYDHNCYLFNRPNIYASLEKKEMLSSEIYETNNMVFSVELSENGENIAYLSNDDNLYLFYNDLGLENNEPPSISAGIFFLIIILGAVSSLIFIKRNKLKKKYI